MCFTCATKSYATDDDISFMRRDIADVLRYYNRNRTDHGLLKLSAVPASDNVETTLFPIGVWVSLLIRTYEDNIEYACIAQDDAAHTLLVVLHASQTAVAGIVAGVRERANSIETIAGDYGPFVVARFPSWRVIISNFALAQSGGSFRADLELLLHFDVFGFVDQEERRRRFASDFDVYVADDISTLTPAGYFTTSAAAIDTDKRKRITVTVEARGTSDTVTNDVVVGVHLLFKSGERHYVERKRLALSGNKTSERFRFQQCDKFNEAADVCVTIHDGSPVESVADNEELRESVGAELLAANIAEAMNKIVLSKCSPGTTPVARSTFGKRFFAFRMEKELAEKTPLRDEPTSPADYSSVVVSVYGTLPTNGTTYDDNDNTDDPDDPDAVDSSSPR